MNRRYPADEAIAERYGNRVFQKLNCGLDFSHPCVSDACKGNWFVANFECSCGTSYKVATESGAHEFEIVPGQCLANLSATLSKLCASSTNEEQRRRSILASLIERTPQIVGYECPSCGRLAVSVDGKIEFYFVREADPSGLTNSISSVGQATCGTREGLIESNLP
jgi:hypothetical protein